MNITDGRKAEIELAQIRFRGGTKRESVLFYPISFHFLPNFFVCKSCPDKKRNVLLRMLNIVAKCLDLGGSFVKGKFAKLIIKVTEEFLS